MTDNDYNDLLPGMHGSNVVWMTFDGNDYEILMAAQVPEPSTLGLLSIGPAVAGIGWRRRKRVT